MRKMISIFAAALLVASFMTSAASAEDTAAKVYYKDGTRLEFGNEFDLKLNFLLISRYTYTDADGGNDTSSFAVKNARYIVSGNMLNKEFSYMIYPDFASDSGGSELKDAWLQWNNEELVNLKMGQFKPAFLRQERLSEQALFFATRSEVNDWFTLARMQGVQAARAFPVGNFYIGIYNGESTGEGINQPGRDNKHNGVAGLDFALGEFGSRGEEGDFRKTQDLAGTIGMAIDYGQGSELLGVDDEEIDVDFDKVALNGDAAIRVAGLEVSGEVAWQKVELDDVQGDDSADDLGFLLQAMYVTGKLGFGGRYGWLDPDDELYGVDTQSEYALVFNYFLKGHNLKVQNVLTWVDTEPADGGESTTDLEYKLNLVGYF